MPIRKFGFQMDLLFLWLFGNCRKSQKSGGTGISIGLTIALPMVSRLFDTITREEREITGMFRIGKSYMNLLI